MVAGLVERGELAPDWVDAFGAVARHRFIPDLIWREREDESIRGGPDLLPLRRAEDPDAWLQAAYANLHVATQVDDGHPDEHGRGWELTSSASQPAIVAEMLAALRVEPGMRVLEIGTGTGYNAALLAHRVGADNVTSVEVDAALAERARHRLAAEGYGDVTVATIDGVHGWPVDAPYDRVIATVAVHDIPPAWVAQTRPGGEVLLPWGSEWYPAALLRLTVGDDHIGRGRIVGTASFMQLRGQRIPRWAAVDLLGSGHADVSTTDLHPWHVAQRDAATSIGWRIPGVRQFYAPGRDGGLGRMNVADVSTQSWARVTLADAPPYKVEHSGPRRLWDEVTDAYARWQETGRPAAEDWLVTVTRDGQAVTLGR